MYNKKLETTIKIHNAGSFCSDEVKEMTLEYYLIDEEVSVEEFGCQKKVFGIEIVKKGITENNKSYIDSSAVRKITCSEKEMKQLIKLLANHTVTPASLKDILEDMVNMGQFGASEDIAGVA